jgi:Spy/CpxP family protein refolding chaperone
LKQEIFGGHEQGRAEFKERMNAVMTERNKYRDMIAQRKDKDRALQDLIAGDKIDLAQLQKAIDEAKESLVRDEVI